MGQRLIKEVEKKADIEKFVLEMKQLRMKLLKEWREQRDEHGKRAGVS